MEHAGRGQPARTTGGQQPARSQRSGGCRPLTSYLHAGIYPPTSPLTVRVVTAKP